MEEYEHWVLQVRDAIARLSNAAYDNGVVATGRNSTNAEIREAVKAKYEAHKALIALLGLDDEERENNEQG